MSMKKITTWLLLVCMAAVPVLGLAEAQPDNTHLSGLVTEVIEGGFIMEDEQLGEVLLNTSDETELEGVLAEKPIEVGMYVLVEYNGILTSSLPPQAHADRVGCYVLTGTIGEMTEAGVMLVGDELFGDVLVHPYENAPHLFAGVPVTVYYDGVMALSLPGQVSARHIVVPSLTGMVDELTENGFLMTDEKGEQVEVLLNEDSLLPENWSEEDGVTGLEVTVYFNGVMTRSLPGQVNALEVVDVAAEALKREAAAQAALAEAEGEIEAEGEAEETIID